MAARALFVSTLQAGAESLGVPLADGAIAQLWAHFTLVLEANRLFNLTRITEPAEAAAKLYADALAPAAWARVHDVPAKTCLDVGTGAGIPALPLAVARPKWQVTAIDSTGKKASFVRECARRVPVENLRVLQARAGEWKAPGRFDLVVLKGIGPLARCVSYADKLVAREGYVIVFKGKSLSRDELDEGQARAERVGLQTWDIFGYDLPLGATALEHTLVVYRRVR